MKQFFKNISEDIKRKKKNTVSSTLKTINNDITTNREPPRRFSNEFLANSKADFLRRRSSTGDDIVILDKLIVLTAKCNYSNDPPMISHTGKYKYISVIEGQKLIIMDATNIKRGTFLVALYNQQESTTEEQIYFKVPSNIFDINIHSDNIYMEALDIFVKYPIILYKIIDHNYGTHLIKLLANKDILENCICNLFQIDITKLKETQHVDNIGIELSTTNSPSIKISYLLYLNEDMVIFRNSFVNYIVSVLIDQNNKEVDMVIVNTIKLGFEFLTGILKLVIPNELIILFKCLHKSLLKAGVSSQLNSYKIIGIFFITRYICIGLSQVTDMLDSNPINNVTHDVLPDHLTPRQLSPSRKIFAALKNKRIVQYITAIVKTFQFVANGTIPNEIHSLHNVACITQVFRTNLISFVEQILLQKSKPMYSIEVLYIEAYNLYIDILSVGRHTLYGEEIGYDPNMRQSKKDTEPSPLFLSLREDLYKLEDNLKYTYNLERIEQIKTYLTKHL